MVNNSCYYCGGECVQLTTYIGMDVCVGAVSLGGVLYLECPQCGEQELPHQLLRSYENKVARIRSKILRGLYSEYPSLFVDSGEFLCILGVPYSRIFLSDKRLPNIFLRIRERGRYYYLRRSVEIYNERIREDIFANGLFDLREFANELQRRGD